MSWVRLRRWSRVAPGGSWGPWHIVDPDSRPRWFSSGSGLCGVSFYKAFPSLDRQEVIELSAGDRLCPRCRRLAAAAVTSAEPIGDGG